MFQFVNGLVYSKLTSICRALPDQSVFFNVSAKGTSCVYLFLGLLFSHILGAKKTTPLSI